MKQETKRRALYFFTCDKCGHKRTSRLYWRAKELVCLKCRRDTVPENQQSLFPVAEEKSSSLTPREAAKELIRRDVSREDSSRNMTYESTAAGRYKGHVIAGGKIIINEIDGKKLDPAEMFSFKELYHEVVREIVIKREKKKVFLVDNNLKVFKGVKNKLEKDIIKIAFGQKKKYDQRNTKV